MKESGAAKGIALVGVGGVARYAHIPSYRDRGVEVVAVIDIDAEVRDAVSEAFGIPAVESITALAGRDDVALLDIATPPATHASLIEEAGAVGLPVLLQKPMCLTREDLRRIETASSAQGLWLRLNLTGRFVSAWEKVKELLEHGAIGGPLLCTINNRDWWDREVGRWDHDVAAYIVHEMMIHHLDLCRWWFGPPTAATARAGTHPRQRLHQPNWVSAIVEHGAVTVQILEDWTMPEFAFATGHPFEVISITGTDGVIRARSDRVELSRSDQNRVDVWHHPRPGQVLPGEMLQSNWFTDSFGRAAERFLADIAAGAAAEPDWQHAVSLTSDTLAIAESLGAERWIRLRGSP